MANKYKKEYMKQRRRIQRFIKSAEKNGFIIPENTLPSIPKKITQQSVNRLKKITPKSIYEKSEYVSDLSYGEIVSANKGKKLRRARQAELSRMRRETEAAIKANTKERQEQYTPKAVVIAYDNVVEHVISRLSAPIIVNYRGSTPSKREVQYYRKEQADSLLRMLQSEVARVGKEEVGKRFLSAGKELETTIDRLFYTSSQEQIDTSYRELAEIIMNRTLTYQELAVIQEIEDANTNFSEH